MKILFFLQALDLGGLEKAFLRMIKGMNQKNNNIEVKLLYNYGKLLEKLPEDLNWSYVFNGKMYVRGITYIYKNFPMNKLADKIFDGDYDVIIAYGEGPVTNILSYYKGPAKTISWLHSVYNEKQFAELCGGIKKAKRVYNSFDSVYCVSTDVKNSLISALGSIDNVKVLINPIDGDTIIKKSLEKVDDTIFDKKKLNFVTVGRLAKEKGFVRLIEIFSKLLNNGYKEVCLYIIGTGKEFKIYNNLIKKYNLENNVIIVGYRDNPMKYVANADVYICSSYREGFSTTVMEALLLGKLVITTDCGGMHDILGSNNEYGLVVNNTDEALYEGIKKICDNREILSSYEQSILNRAKDFDYNTLIGIIEKEIERVYMNE